MSVVITREIAEKVRDVVDAGLSSGLGERKPGRMCVEAAVCYALGLPHDDDPGCVSQPLRKLKICLNDAAWSSNQARAAGLRRLAVAQLGSDGALDEKEFISRVVGMTIRKVVPVGLRAAATVNPVFAEPLEAAAVRCEQEGTREVCEFARSEAHTASASYAAASYAYASASYAAAAAAYARTRDRALAAAAASYAADDAAAASVAAAYARTRDRALAAYAEHVVQILVEMGAPGCQFLDLVPVDVSGL